MKKTNEITVQNAEGEQNTKATILIQNQIDFEPKVSVIIPVYNVEEYLRQCLDSVINQTLKEIEIICVDDGSTDSSLEILKEYAEKDKRITVITQKNSGVGYSRNLGIKISKGTFISFIDPDDYYPDTHTLLEMYKAAIKYNVKICGGSLIIFDNQKNVTIHKKNEFDYFTKNKLCSYKDFQYDYGFQRYIYQRNFIQQNNIYFPNYRRFQDPPFMIKAFAEAEQFYALKSYVYSYRFNYKKINWTEEKVFHLLNGLRDNLSMSQKYDLDKLYSLTMNRLNKEYKKIIMEQYSERIQNIKNEIMNICLNYAHNKYKNTKLTPKVSIVLPIYNAEPFLRECLDSIINQTLKDIEIICVNDGSTDKSLDIIKEYADKDIRIRYIDKPNAGYGQTMNCGIDLATGEYIGIVEPDDFIELNMYETLYNKAKCTNVDFIKGDIYFWWSHTNKRKYSNIISDKNLYNKIQYDLSNKGLTVSAIANCAGIYKHNFLQNSNIRFNETPGASFQDQGFYYQVIFYGKSSLFINKPFYHYRQDNSNSSINTLNKVSCIFEEYINKKLNELKHKEKFYPLFYSKMINSYLWNLSKSDNNMFSIFKNKIANELTSAINNGLSKDIIGDTLWDKISPFINTKLIIPVILSADNNYAKYMYITMLSMLKNADKSTSYDFYLLVPSSYSKKNEELFIKLRNEYQCCIHFIDMKDAFSNLTMQISHISSPTYYRLLAADILPKEYNKCIYLDCDICVCKDLSELYNIDMKNNYIAGVRAAGYYFDETANCKRLNLSSMKQYINAGVLLMNLKQIRKDNLTKKLVALSYNNFSSQDQDVINVACYNKIIILPLRYNVMTKYNGLFDNKSSDYNKLKDVYGIEEVNYATKYPVIIHYADKIKPWQNKKSILANIWNSYADQCHFYDSIFNTSYQIYTTKSTLSYKLFNFIPLFTFKQRNEKKVWKILGLPIFKTLKYGTNKAKYYIFGIPVLKIRRD